MIKVWLAPFWTICSWGPGVTTAPLRSQVTWASGVETSHWNVASSPSWTVRGVSSETSLTGGGSGRRGEAVNWIPLSPSLLICSLGLSPHSPTNYYSLSEILLWVVHGDSPKDQDNNSLVSSLQSQPGTSSQVSSTNTSFTMALLRHLTVTETYLLFQFRVWAQRSKTTWLMPHNSQRAESGLDPGQVDSRGPVLLYWAIQHARVLEKGVGSLRVMSCTHWWEPQTAGWVRCRGEEPRTGGGSLWVPETSGREGCTVTFHADDEDATVLGYVTQVFPSVPSPCPPHPQHLPGPGLFQLHPPLVHQALPVLVPAHRAPWPGEVHHQL